MVVLIEQDISGHMFLLLLQEDVPNDIIGCTFLLLYQEVCYNFWVRIGTIIYEHGTKVTRYPGHMHTIRSNNDYHYEGVFHVIVLPIILYTRGMKPFCGNSNASFHMKDYILLLTIMTKDLVIILCLNGGQGRLPHSLSLVL